MSLKLYNTKTRSKEEFKTIDGSNIVRMYSCGPTVYDYAHIGNFSMYIFTDLLRRYLENGPVKYSVKHVMNITNVGHLKVDNDENYDLNAGEDKFEVASRKTNLDPWEISKKYTAAFLDDMKKLNIKNPAENNGYIPLATDNITYMQEIIKKLIDNGYAYISEQENIYFDVSKFPSYGKFSGKTLEDLEAGKGGRINVKELLKDKKNIFDFSLWITDESHIMKWAFPDVIKSGKMGYPGWHIECSAMSMRFLTDVFNSEKPDFEKFKTLDIHTGGEDHIFPHHEDEIAQSEGCTGKNFSNFWLHRRHVLVNGEKMSKSKGNFYTISELEEGKLGNIKFNPLDFRMWVLSGHYRTQMNFTLDGMIQAKKNREKIENFYNTLDKKEYSVSNKQDINEYRNTFYEALDDDLNTPKALSVIFEIINNFKSFEKSEIKSFFDEFNSFFAIIRRHYKIEFSDTFMPKDDIEIRVTKPNNTPKEISDLAEKRFQAKLNKDYATADSLRDELKNLGYEVKDGKDSYEIIKK